MIKVKNNSRRKQLRRCSVCNKVGHNRTTCPLENRTTLKTKMNKIKLVNTKKENDDQRKVQNNSDTVTKNSSTPLRFYVHHVNNDSNPSEHIVNLKKNNPWNDVKAVCHPRVETIFHHYHKYQKPTASVEITNSNKNYTSQTVKSKCIISDKDDPFTSPNFAPLSSIQTLAVKTIKKDLKSKKIRKQMYSFSTLLFHARQWQQIYLPMRRTIASLVLFSMIIFAPVQASSYYKNLKNSASGVADSSISGFKNLQQSTSQIIKGDLINAQQLLNTSLENFNDAVTKMNSKHQWLQKALVYTPFLKKEIKSRQSLIEVGYDIGVANSIIIDAINKINYNSNNGLTDNLKIASSFLEKAVPYYKRAQENLNSTNVDIIPVEFQDDYSDFKNIFNIFVNDLVKLNDSSTALLNILGDQGFKRYLVVFQNQNEIRPTGGFIGSFALMEINNGKIVDIKIPAGGSYDLQGQLEEYLEPPTPLLTIVDRWYFRDANWFADFPTSAEKLLWFYRHSRHITADGVIAVNAEVLNRILRITGPIKDEKRDLVITADNAIDTIQNVVEKGPEKLTNEPKKIIGEMAPKFIEYFTNIKSGEALTVLTQLQQALEKKEIQLYFKNLDANKIASNLGWDGKILPTDKQDYLMVVNSNLGGQKSDSKIEQNIDHETVINRDGDIMVTVVVERKHTGKKDEEFYGVTNLNYIKMYVPQGSQLIEAGGFTMLDEKSFKVPHRETKKDETLAQIAKKEYYDPTSGTRITTESDKTVFANWIVTEPQQTSKIYFTYKLPFNAFESLYTNSKSEWYSFWKDKDTNKTNYQLIVQKQSGINSKFSSTIIYPEDWKPVWKNDTNLILASNGAKIENIDLDTDKNWTLLMISKK